MKYLFNGIEVINPTIEVAQCVDLMRGLGVVQVWINIHMGESVMNYLLGNMDYADTWNDADIEKFVADNLPLHEIQ